MAEVSIKQCQECGANVYPEHIQSGQAGLHAGKLLCTICYQDKLESDSDAPVSAAVGGASRSARQEKADDLSPVALSDEGGSGQEFSGERSSKIHTGAGRSGIGSAQSAAVDDSRLERALRDTGRGATRCRTFHSKLNESAIAYMNEHINTWVDKNPEIEIKFAHTTVGLFEGKHSEQNLIITVFY